MWSARPGSRAATVPERCLVIPKRGASIGTNKKRLTARPSVLDPNLMGIVPHVGRLDPYWLYQWFLGFDLLSITSGSSVPQLNKRDLEPLLISIPPLELQSLFASHALMVADLVHRLTLQIAYLDELFASLQQKAFRGEL